MLGIEDYGSGSDDDGGDEQTTPAAKFVTRRSAPLLPPTATSSSKLSLPTPRRNVKKITIGLPSLTTSKDDDEDDLKDNRSPLKRPRLESGAGVSSLTSMLPAPKRRTLSPRPTERVLGGGEGKGLVFNTSRSIRVAVTRRDDEDEDSRQESGDQHSATPLAVSSSDEKLHAQVINPQTSPSTVDFFSLGTTTTSSSKTTLTTTSNPSLTTSTPNLTSSTSQISSAPIVPTFKPPEPSQMDEYPGYYLLPSGAWAAHDPAYYAKFVKKWQNEYDAQVRALEKGTAKGFEGLKTAAVEEVDAMKEMENAKLEMRIREDRKAVTQGAGSGPAAPNMTITASKMSGIARSRHQLSTLLKEAYENREALEEKIAQGKRNRKEAGNKYGF